MRYMLTIVGEEGGWEDTTPEDMKAGMQAWFTYTEDLNAAGVFVAGEGLQESATATTVRASDDGGRVVTDGPFAETKEQLGGFYLIDVDDLDAAIDWAKKVPIRGGGVEVRPVMNYDQTMGSEEPAAAEVSS
jgi:hypothetical protein